MGKQQSIGGHASSKACADTAPLTDAQRAELKGRAADYALRIRKSQEEIRTLGAGLRAAVREDKKKQEAALEALEEGTVAPLSKHTDQWESEFFPSSTMRGE